MASIQPSVGKLPQRLRNFFARYPPQVYSALVAPRPTPPEGEVSTEANLPSPYTPDREAKGAHKQDREAWSFSKSLLHNDPSNQNPFLPRKIFTTGKWIGPRYGLRQQADLVKLAIKYNVEPLLPPGTKSTEYKEARLAERGLRIKGTGIGQKVKGHKWERTMEARLEDRRKAMTEMPEMIRLWKQVSPAQLRLRTAEEEVLIRSTERSRSWLETMAQAVNGMTLLRPVFFFALTLGFRYCRAVYFISTILGRRICMNHLQGFGLEFSFLFFYRMLLSVLY